MAEDKQATIDDMLRPERNDPRKEILTNEKLVREYQEWRDSEMTARIVNILRDLSRANLVPTHSMVDPNYAAALFHQRAMVDWCIDTMINVDLAENLTHVPEPDATYAKDN